MAGSTMIVFGAASFVIAAHAAGSDTTSCANSHDYCIVGAGPAGIQVFQR